MLVYLIRHGEALSREEDPIRPLSKKGVHTVENLAGFIADNFKMSIGIIHHSGKARAAQTATILARTMAQSPEVMQSDGLDPLDDPGVWSERLSVEEMDTMLVGHLPHLSRLASLLLTWNPEVGLLEFDVAAAVCLEGAAGNWLLKWMITPETLKQGRVSGDDP
ncbi:MAG: phosphohistidine phosphatase SixA [bacterium]